MVYPREMSKKEKPWVEPVVLEGNYVRLEPARPKHARHLAKHADPELFKHFVALQPSDQSVNSLKGFIQANRGWPNTLPFAIIDLASRRPVGMTSYLDIRPEHSGLEIGFTWLGRDYQGTKVNPEAKLLLLEHAFERLDAERVQLKTDGRNLQSQRAIAKLGAKHEGVLRRHFRMPDGFMRDTVMFSITKLEWPDVKMGLIRRLS